jgi:hypothetical protein
VRTEHVNETHTTKKAMKKALRTLDFIRYAAAGAALFSALANIVFQPTTVQNWTAAVIGSVLMLILVKARHMV